MYGLQCIIVNYGPKLQVSSNFVVTIYSRAKAHTEREREREREIGDGSKLKREEPEREHAAEESRTNAGKVLQCFLLL